MREGYSRGVREALQQLHLCTLIFRFPRCRGYRTCQDAKRPRALQRRPPPQPPFPATPTQQKHPPLHSTATVTASDANVSVEACRRGEIESKYDGLLAPPNSITRTTAIRRVLKQKHARLTCVGGTRGGHVWTEQRRNSLPSHCTMGNASGGLQHGLIQLNQYNHPQEIRLMQKQDRACFASDRELWVTAT